MLKCSGNKKCANFKQKKIKEYEAINIHRFKSYENIWSFFSVCFSKVIMVCFKPWHSLLMTLGWMIDPLVAIVPNKGINCGLHFQL